MTNAAQASSNRPTSRKNPGITRLEILQVGDVHYPDAINQSLGDVKDLMFPAGVRDITTFTPLQSVVRAIMAEASRRKLSSILLCGDLTSVGKIDYYRQCVTYLHTALNLASYDRRALHVVPGNHDVDRSNLNPADIFQKFQALQDAWQDVGLGILTVKEPRMTDVTTGKARIRLYSMNSSVGCGEVRHLPTKIRSQLQTLLADHIKTEGSIENAFETVGETLDTPAFQKDDVEAVCADIAQQESNTLPIILSHHNLLPQALPRIELYTELINSGYVRSRLGKLKRPLIYCHGHIHQNAMETVQQAGSNGSFVLCVAAPALWQGFNILQLEYSSKHFPLGCRIQRFKIDETDGEIERSETRVPLMPHLSRPIRVVAHDILPRILSQLPDREVRFSELVTALGTAANDFPDLKTALIEAEWLCLIDVMNASEEVEHWNIRRLPR